MHVQENGDVKFHGTLGQSAPVGRPQGLDSLVRENLEMSAKLMDMLDHLEAKLITGEEPPVRPMADPPSIGLGLEFTNGVLKDNLNKLNNILEKL